MEATVAIIHFPYRKKGGTVMQELLEAAEKLVENAELRENHHPRGDARWYWYLVPGELIDQLRDAINKTKGIPPAHE